MVLPQSPQWISQRNLWEMHILSCQILKQACTKSLSMVSHCVNEISVLMHPVRHHTFYRFWPSPCSYAQLSICASATLLLPVPWTFYAPPITGLSFCRRIFLVLSLRSCISHSLSAAASAWKPWVFCSGVGQILLLYPSQCLPLFFFRHTAVATMSLWWNYLIHSDSPRKL